MKVLQSVLLVKTGHWIQCVATRQVVGGKYNFDQWPHIYYLHCFARRTDHFGDKTSRKQAETGKPNIARNTRDL